MTATVLPDVGSILPDVGDTLTVPEAHYCYGTGTLSLRITHVEGVEVHDGQPWLYLRGVPLTCRGEGPERGALVRATAFGVSR